jgi:transcriptional regulator with XRE-family HTH domain
VYKEIVFILFSESGVIIILSNTFGNKLKTLRLRSGFTQAQLAGRLNISASTVGMYEQGRREPDNDTLSKLCLVLNTSVDYLLGINKNLYSATNLEVDVVISDFINFLEKQDNLMFNGQPINEIEKIKIVSALKVAMAVSMSDFYNEYRA